MKRYKKYFDEIIRHAKDDGASIYFPEIVNIPKGKKQDYDGDSNIFQFVYVDQKTGYSGDDFYGHIYYPVGTVFLKVGFNC